jgi:endonuclease G, mitochondrial
MGTERSQRLRTYLESISPDQSLESTVESPISEEATEDLPPETVEKTRVAAQKLQRGEDLSHEEQFLTEAIIIPDKRPAVDIVEGDYRVTHKLWMHFQNDARIHERLIKAIPSIGRIELPGHPSLPYGGTGFVVGQGLLMTNRHVAEIFASGLGTRNLVFKPGLGAGIDFKRERDREISAFVSVERS